MNRVQRKKLVKRFHLPLSTLRLSCAYFTCIIGLSSCSTLPTPPTNHSQHIDQQNTHPQHGHHLTPSDLTKTLKDYSKKLKDPTQRGQIITYLKENGHMLLNEAIEFGDELLNEPPSEQTIAYFTSLVEAIKTLRESHIYLPNMKNKLADTKRKKQLAVHRYASDQYKMGNNLMKDNRFRQALNHLYKTQKFAPTYKDTAMLVKQAENLSLRYIVIRPSSSPSFTKQLYKAINRKKTYYLTAIIDDRPENMTFAHYVLEEALPPVEDLPSKAQGAKNLAEPATKNAPHDSDTNSLPNFNLTLAKTKDFVKTYRHIDLLKNTNTDKTNETEYAKQLAKKILIDIDRDLDPFQLSKTQ